MAAGTSTPVEAGQGPGVLNIAATIGAKIRDAAQEAKEEREKAAEKGESPKKGSLFKSSLANQFNPVKSKKQKSQWAKQFDWNKKKSDAEQKVKAPTAGATGDAGKARLKEFIAGGFTAILQDTGMMVSKMDTMTALGSENLSEATKSSGTLTVIKETLDAQTELRRKALEEAKFARAERKLEKRQDVAGVNDPTPDEKKEEEGEGDGGGGGGPFDWLLGGLDLLDTGLGIKSLLGGGAKAGAAKAGGLGLGATAGIVGGVGLAMSGLGEGMFQGTRFADQQNQMMKDKGQEMSDAGNPMGMLMGGLGNIGMVGNEFNKIQGAILDVGGAPFRYAIEAAMHPFLNEEQKENQAKNLAKFDARVREYSRGWMNRIDFMDVISDEKGGFGNIYGNDAAQKEMMDNMGYSSGGIVPLNRGGTIVDDPTRGILTPGTSVIPLNRNVGKKMLGGGSSANMAELPIVGVSAMMLGVASGMLGKVDAGSVGDEVQQKIRKASKEFGISNLTFTSAIGKGSFGKMDPKKDSKDFFAKLLNNFDMFGGGSKKGGSGGGGGGDNTVPGADLSGTGVNNEVNLAANTHAEVGKTDVFDPTGTINSRGRPHMGLDIGTSQQKGYYVGMKKSGKVVNKSYDDVSGHWVGIDVGNNTEYRFMHLAHESPLKVGDDYNGETIGEIGSTGRSSSEHLHFEKLVNGLHVDPSADADALLDIGKGLNRNFDPAAARIPVAVTGTPDDPGSGAVPEVTREAEKGGSFNPFNPFSWFSGQSQKAVSGELEGVSNKTLGGSMYNRRKALEEAMRAGRGYQSGGSRAATRESQRKARIADQRASMHGLNSGGIPIRGGTFGMLMGTGYPAVFKGREAIRVKLRPGVAGDKEITLGGKRWFGVRQGRDMIYVSHFKANQTSTSLTTGDNVSALAKPPAPAPKETVTPTRPPAPAPSPAPVVAPLPPAIPPAPASTAEGSFGDEVPAGKTSAMVFADFLYPDLV